MGKDNEIFMGNNELIRKGKYFVLSFDFTASYT